MDDVAEIKLKSFELKNDDREFIFELKHSTGETTLTQDLVIKEVYGSWVAEIKISDFPEMNCVSDAALKMADWLSRLSFSIKKGRELFDKLEDI